MLDEMKLYEPLIYPKANKYIISFLAKLFFSLSLSCQLNRIFNNFTAKQTCNYNNLNGKTCANTQ